MRHLLIFFGRLHQLDEGLVNLLRRDDIRGVFGDDVVRDVEVRCGTPALPAPIGLVTRQRSGVIAVHVLLVDVAPPRPAPASAGAGVNLTGTREASFCWVPMGLPGRTLTSEAAWLDSVTDRGSQSGDIASSA